MSHSSKSTNAPVGDGRRPWLEEQVYQPKRQRTLLLVRQAINALIKGKQRVSLAAIVSKSKQLDRHKIGISASAILGNVEARALYEAKRQWRAPAQRRRFSVDVLHEIPTPRIKLHRDLRSVYERYIKLTKQDLAMRLIKMEQSYLGLEETWLKASERLFNSMLNDSPQNKVP